MTISSIDFRKPANMVPDCAANVFPHSLQRYRGRFLLWTTMLPCPIFPLAQHARFGQNCSDAFIACVLFSIHYTMPMNARFFKSSSLPLHQLMGFYHDILKKFVPNCGTWVVCGK